MNRSFFLIVIATIFVHIIEITEAQQWITGKITHDGSAMIDEDVQVDISLRDVSLMDVASKLISSTTVSNPKTFPISYKLSYDPSDIESGHVYALSARISRSGDKLWYINDVHTQVPLTETPSPNIDVAVIRVGGSSSGGDSTRMIRQSSCPSVKCPKPKTCPYGYQKKDGCEICRCNDPCNPPERPVLCGSNRRCFVEKKPDGTFGHRCGTLSSREFLTSTNAGCTLPKVSGPCFALFRRFFYNPTTGNCEKFIYGGCGGNANNFKTKLQCEMNCIV